MMRAVTRSLSSLRLRPRPARRSGPVLPQADGPLPVARGARRRWCRRRPAGSPVRRRCRGSRSAASGPARAPSSRSMRTPSAWKVQITTSFAARGRSAPLARSRISAAALLVKVMAAMRLASRPAWISRAILCVITRVLPEPAPASTRQGPCMWCTACICAGFRVDIGGGLIAARDDSQRVVIASLATVWYEARAAHCGTAHDARARLPFTPPLPCSRCRAGLAVVGAPRARRRRAALRARRRVGPAARAIASCCGRA